MPRVRDRVRVEVRGRSGSKRIEEEAPVVGEQDRSIFDPVDERILGHRRHSMR